MAKRVWVSLPLTTTTDLADSAVVGFLKGGKKTLEIETGAFITKWLVEKSVPFSIDFDSATVDRKLVMEALPDPIQKSLEILAAAAPAEAGQAPQTAPPAPAETSAVDLLATLELAPVEIPAPNPMPMAEPIAEPAPVDAPAEPATTAEPAPVDAPAAEPGTLTEPAPVEIATAEAAAMAEPVALVATGELAVPEEQESGSKRASRIRVKRPKTGSSEVA
jgi:hypothetical protein